MKKKQLKQILAITLFFISTLLMAGNQNMPTMKLKDKIRLKESFRILKTVGDQVWPGWSELNMPVLLIDDSTEYLIHHPKPPEEFQFSEKDDVLGAIVARPRQNNPGLAAAYPLYGMYPAVLMGTAENTGRTSSQWTITVLHEMFHVYQMHQNDFTKSASLEIGPQNNPMWQLNYPYPYEDDVVRGFTHQLAASLNRVLTARNKKETATELKGYTELRTAYKAFMEARSGSDKDYKYCKFQEWKEGMARYTEWALLKVLSEHKYQAHSDFSSLADYEPFAERFAAAMKNIPDLLNQTAKTNFSRPNFYTLGAVQGLILDQLDKNWKTQVFSDSLWLDDILDTAIANHLSTESE
jgi:hypothetical protein